MGERYVEGGTAIPLIRAKLLVVRGCLDPRGLQKVVRILPMRIASRVFVGRRRGIEVLHLIVMSLAVPEIHAS